MLRKITCAVAGVSLACAAAFSLSLIAESKPLGSLDLRWLHTATKGDRLPVRASANESRVISFGVPSHSTTVVTRVPARPIVESAVHTPPATTVRTIPVKPVRDVPNENETKKERLPQGCEPAFSPVTNPAFAHIGVRCDS